MRFPSTSYAHCHYISSPCLLVYLSPCLLVPLFPCLIVSLFPCFLVDWKDIHGMTFNRVLTTTKNNKTICTIVAMQRGWRRYTIEHGRTSWRLYNLNPFLVFLLQWQEQHSWVAHSRQARKIASPHRTIHVSRFFFISRQFHLIEFSLKRTTAAGEWWLHFTARRSAMWRHLTWIVWMAI